jgi:hypothetical protein
MIGSDPMSSLVVSSNPREEHLPFCTKLPLKGTCNFRFIGQGTPTT